MKNKATQLMTAAAAAMAFAASSHAGTVNIDLEFGGATTAALPGAIGTGSTWNSVIATTLDLVDENGSPTDTDITFVDVTGPFFGLVSNDVQNDQVYKTGGDNTLKLRIGGLRPGEPYKLAFYTSISAVLMRYTVHPGTANEQFLDATGNTASPLPGTQGADYVLFTEVVADGAGEITMHARDVPNTVGACAGIQIQGWLGGEAKPWKADGLLSKRRNDGYIGDNLYFGAVQRRVQNVDRRAKFFIRMENDGSACGDFSLKGKRSNRKARRIYRDLSGGGNVTGEVSTGMYQVQLDPGEQQMLKMVVRPARGYRGTLNDRLKVKPVRASLQGFGDMMFARTRVQ